MIISQDYVVLHADVVYFAENKRRMYDQYGKEGLNQTPRRSRHHGPMPDDVFDIPDFGFAFNFRDPEDVFREFFGVHSPFDGLIQGMNRAQGRQHRNSHPQSTVSSQLFFPFNFNMGGFDDFLGANHPGGAGFTSFTSQSNISGPSQGAVKRTSTSTKFINGKKIMTKKILENGLETSMTYENDVLISKFVNGVPIPITLR
ncbi:DnaJ subfamily B member 2 [Blattella germanica]|nr:DnaJ subfamily B member 2 [Blattella germanica]